MVRTLTGPYLITTTPSVTRCSGCGSTVLAVTVTGIDRHIDPATLTPEGELAALLRGCRTYELHWRNDHIVPRTVEKIRSSSSDSPVLADHDCRRPPEGQIDHRWTEVATVMIMRLLGGVIVTADGTPPF